MSELCKLRAENEELKRKLAMCEKGVAKYVHLIDAKWEKVAKYEKAKSLLESILIKIGNIRADTKYIDRQITRDNLECLEGDIEQYFKDMESKDDEN